MVSFSKILFSGEWSGNGERRKEDFCEALNPHYLIEDSLDNSRSCAEKGTKILLLDCPWNKCSDEDLPFGAKRVLNWRKIGDVL